MSFGNRKRKRNSSSSWELITKDATFFENQLNFLQKVEEDKLNEISKKSFINVIYFHNYNESEKIQNYQNLKKEELKSLIFNQLKESYNQFKKLVVRNHFFTDENQNSKLVVGDSVIICHNSFKVGEGKIIKYFEDTAEVFVAELYPFNSEIQSTYQEGYNYNIHMLNLLKTPSLIIYPENDFNQQNELNNNRNSTPELSESEKDKLIEELRKKNQQLKNQLGKLKQHFDQLEENFYQEAKEMENYFVYTEETNDICKEINGKTLHFSHTVWNKMKNYSLKEILTEIINHHPHLTTETKPSNINKSFKKEVCQFIRQNFIKKQDHQIQNTWRQLVHANLKKN